MLGKNKLLQTKGVPSFKEKLSPIPSIAPVERKEANIEAEKGETILKPDGELGKFLGKKHSKTSNAGTPAQVEPGSFIFSDKIKLPKEYIATILDKEVSKVSKMTPAELSLKFPTKMYLDVLRDENADKRAKNTADIMLKKSLQGLQTVFEAQQMFKEDNGIQEGTMMANGGYLPKAEYGDPYTNILDFVNKFKKNKEAQWLTDKPTSQYLYQSSPDFNKFVSDPNSWQTNSKGQVTKASPLIQQQYQGQNFYKNGEYDTSPEGRYARINQHFAYNDGTKAGTKGKSTYNYMSTMLQNDKEKTALLPENAPAWYQTDLQNKGYKLIDPKYIEGMSKEDLLQAGYDGRTIYNDPKKINKEFAYKAMFDPSNNRENNDSIGDVIDPRYDRKPYVSKITPDSQNQNPSTGENTSNDFNPFAPITPDDSTVTPKQDSPGKSKPTQIRDYVTENMNLRKGQLYSRMFDQDRLPYMPHYNEAVPYQRATPMSYAPTLAGLRAGSEQLDNSNTPDQIKSAVFSDYLSKAQEQIGKIDVQNQSNNAQVTQQNFNAFANGINRNQEINNGYKQQYDQLVQNQEQARTNRKYTLQDAIAELNARKAENNFDYELMNADPTSNYNVTRQNKGFKEYLNFDWKERNRLNTINSNMLDNDQLRNMYGADWDSMTPKERADIRTQHLLGKKR